MRQWIKNLAEQIKTAEYCYNQESSYEKYLHIDNRIMNLGDTFFNEGDGKLYSVIKFKDSYNYWQYIKLYEDEKDLLKPIYENRIKELDQKEIDNFIALCK